jgi:large subunit ribosomal protein L35
MAGKKFKTHSGAKKRFSARSSGKIKRGQCGKRHLLSHKSSKRKRHLGDRLYVHSANEYQVSRQLGL